MDSRSRVEMVIFDWDGTLADSRAQVVACMRAATRDCLLPDCTEPEYATGIGLSLQQHFSNLYPQLSPTELGALVLAYRKHYFSGPYEHRLFDGVHEVLQRLTDEGLLLAVATGKGKKGLTLALQETGVAHFFATTRTAEETASKPNPLMLEEILSDFSLRAAQAVMVGDTSFDLNMASHIGMPSVAVSYGVHERAVLTACAPAAIIDDISQLPALVVGE